MKVDVVIVGGGIAGASAAYFLSQHGSVALVEREEHFSYHSSGRTAAQFTVGIGAPTMRRMAQASRSFLETPPEGFCTHSILTPRGCLTVAKAGKEGVLRRLQDNLASAGARAEYLDKEAALALFPALVAENVDAGVHEPDAMDIDVDLLLQGYLRGAKARGASLLTRTPIESIRRESGAWIVGWQGGEIAAPILVNAAGAWADEVSRMAGLAPIGIVPHRRTAFTFALQKEFDTRSWPHVGSVDYNWYVKPEQGCLMGSLSDAVPTQPGDVYPEDLDVAQAIENIEAETRLRIGRPLSQWAGLRSFVADRNPVAGSRPDAPGFFWLAGQGGCGILTSPAMGQALAALVAGHDLPAHLTEIGVSARDLSPSREGLVGGA
ncbi:NAD(P)/FAD-dependent oxidoreductase [Bosea lathyri]|uniref:Glycine/D-amino acid oxidase n=1 Tax=Bosea lathyri TaxID=1036778 RepID=A0A1H6D816_9HYPH|nr:FAD-binding oxidoreductase [Bosea lathyri]SEG80905.1 Glycine/D-amino acid oxidase [Bosea lathyri]